MKSLIIGFPGLSHESEKGRLEEIAGHFPDHDFKKVKYPGITKSKENIVIPFSIEQFSKGVKIPQGYYQIGIITSSTGAAVFSHYLSEHPELDTQINWYVAISPFCKLNPMVITQVEQLNKTQQDLDIGESNNKVNNKKRIIPNTHLPNLLSLDANSKTCKTNIPHTLTLLGTQDSIIDLTEAENHHYKMGGHKTNIKKYNAPHSLNPQSTQDAIEFIREITRP
ncbi:MAG: hypothetical protein ABIH59_03010 [archaeon]